MYRTLWKRFFDFLIALTAIIILLPLLLILTVVGAVALQGHPFFTQERPGKNEKIFRLVKFRTMNNRTDENGELLPDAERLTLYGRFLRSTSLDELPELFNILFGQMSLVGPRPLLVKYLPLYNEYQHRRHDVLPGLTGWAQVNGRNLCSWEEKFELDVWYTENISLKTDVSILLKTVGIVIKREGIHAVYSETAEEFKGNVTV